MSGRVFWDTNLFVYWIEQVALWHGKVERLLERQESKGLKTVTSSLTLAEILVRPVLMDDVETANKYREIIERVGCLTFGPEEAWIFAELRAKHAGVKAPDCIQLACAAVHGVELFLTNDARLTSLRIRGIREITSLDAWLSKH